MRPEFHDLRELWFGDVPLSEWKAQGPEGDSVEPWSSFAAVRDALARGDSAAAITRLHDLVNRPHLESRQVLQAWHFLRQLGVQPLGAVAKRVHGVVLDVHLPDGLDTLAAYADHSARYLNHGGRVIVWESPDDAIDRLIDDLIRLGQLVADAIGPWTEARPGPPAAGHARLNLLTPSGLHFGEGPFDALSSDPMGGPLIGAGTKLMQALIERARHVV